MKKVISIRVDEEVHHHLKVLALAEKTSIGQVIASMVNARMDGLRRVAEVMPLIMGKRPVEGYDYTEMPPDQPAVQVGNDRKKKRGKKHRR